MAAAVSSDGSHSSPRPPLTLRTAASPAKRHSVTGSVSSPKAAASLSRLMSATRISSPGATHSSNGNGNGNGNGPSSPVCGAGGAGGGGGLGSDGGGLLQPRTSCDIPRLPRVSDTGDRLTRPPGTLLRRASTMSTSAMTREVLSSLGSGGCGGSPVGAIKEEGGERGGSGGGGGESAALLRKERNALRQEKATLLQNKRRLEALLSKMLEQPGASGGASMAAAGSGSGSHDGSELSPTSSGGLGGGGRPSLVRSSTMRAQVLKALDESTGLEKQLSCDAPFPSEDAEAKVRELTAKLAELQADHDVAVARLEGELAYRRTQASASIGHLQKQLGDAEEELRETRRELTSAEARVKQLTAQVAELRGQLTTVNRALADKTQQAQELKDMLGMDKGTLLTVNEMLKEQLSEANADRQAKAQQLAELEYALVRRDALLAEAHERMNAAAAAATSAAAATAAAAVSAASRVSLSGIGGTAAAAWGSDSVAKPGMWQVPLPPAPAPPRGSASGVPNGGAHGGHHGYGSGGGGGGGGSRVKVLGGGEVVCVSEQSSYDGERFEADDDQ